MGRRNSNTSKDSRRSRNSRPWHDASEDDRHPVAKKELFVVRAITPSLKRYDAAIRSSEVVFGDGPAGTGKTLMAVARAAQALDDGVIDKIIVTRPAVTVDGEEFGFLPGELEDKYAPYLRPVSDHFIKVVGKGKFDCWVKLGKIEAIPMAFMRGLSVRAWIIADEMQNATYGQFKMLLTRGEDGTKFIINGDSTQQNDLGSGESGFRDVMRRLSGTDGVSHVIFDEDDIVRGGITQRIVRALS